MAQPTVILTDFTPFFGFITSHLISAGVVVDDSRVTEVACPPEEVGHFAADRDVLLWPQEEVSDKDTAAGGGVYDTRAIATLFVVARTRLELDKAGSDRRRLRDASLGHYAFRAAVRSVVQMDWPEDAVKNAYGVQPMRWVRTRAPKREKEGRVLTDWVYSILEVEIVYPVLLNPRNL